MKNVKLTITKPEDIGNLRTKLRSLKLQLLQFQSITVRQLANSTILDTIHKKMKEANFSEKIIVNTVVSNIEFRGRTKVMIHFKSELFTETGFDIALVREKTGTRDHKVAPAVKQALRWIELGIVKFSKGHEVSGIKALHIIAKTLDELAGTIQLQYDNKLQHWVAANLGGTSIAV